MSAPPPAGEPNAVLRWTVHPALRSPVLSIVLAALVLGAGPLAYEVSGQMVLGLLAPWLLLGSLLDWFLPRRYELAADGVRVSGPLRRAHALAWGDVRRVAPVRAGLYLSPRFVDSRWLRTHGLFLRTTGQDRTAVLEFVRARAPESAA